MVRDKLPVGQASSLHTFFVWPRHASIFAAPIFSSRAEYGEGVVAMAQREGKGQTGECE